MFVWGKQKKTIRYGGGVGSSFGLNHIGDKLHFGKLLLIQDAQLMWVCSSLFQKKNLDHYAIHWMLTLFGDKQTEKKFQFQTFICSRL